MTATTLSGREFNQNSSKAKQAAAAGPVFITDRGRPAHVLLSFDAYQQLIGPSHNLVDLLAMPVADGDDDVEFDPAPLSGILRTAEFD